MHRIQIESSQLLHVQKPYPLVPLLLYNQLLLAGQHWESLYPNYK